MVYFNGNEINNFDDGDYFDLAIKEIYILMKLAFPEVSRKHIDTVIGLYERAIQRSEGKETREDNDD